MLYVNDAMRITRNAAGKFDIEGPASEDFYSEFLERIKIIIVFCRNQGRGLQPIRHRLVISSLLLLLLLYGYCFYVNKPDKEFGKWVCKV
jgi:hypothetical protein